MDHVQETYIFMKLSHTWDYSDIRFFTKPIGWQKVKDIRLYYKRNVCLQLHHHCQCVLHSFLTSKPPPPHNGHHHWVWPVQHPFKDVTDGEVDDKVYRAVDNKEKVTDTQEYQ